ncbi:hypothetical protein NQD34_016972 [Periophthalmus magnuspinnatus]|nr:hypothetical protein NQD34_016972 [Periophthalmus magnuspinnatus]
MANGHVEIHDPIKGQNGITCSTESKKSTSSLERPEDMPEFRILMAYAQRRRPQTASQENPSTPNGNNPSMQTDEITLEKKKKKKKSIWKRFPKVLTCLKPQTKEEIPSPDDAEEDTGIETFRCVQEEDFEDVAVRLAEISAEIPFIPPEIETDSNDDEVEKVIGLLLRDAGDRLYERELKDTNMTDLLGNYSFFEKVILSLLLRMGLSTNTESLGPKVSPKTQIAVTCEATTRLSVLDTLPMNRLLGHGARFLKTHFSSWAEEQGGYEKAFDSQEDDEVH